MALDDIILRSSSNAPLVTKGSELTYAELDGNFIELYEYLTNMNAGSALAPWSVATTYTGTNYVSYNGNIYQQISSPSLGQVPDLNPTVWQLSSVGALAHEKNKDQYLDFGGANQVSATEVNDIVDNQIIVITPTDFTNAITGSTLKPNRIYKVDLTLAGLSSISFNQPFLYVRSLTNNSYSGNGWISLLVGSSIYSNWNPNGTYLSSSYVQYKTIVYENLTGGNNIALPPSLDTTNWQLVSTSTFYQTVFFHDVSFKLEGSVTINNFTDKWGNVYSYADLISRNIANISGLMKGNKCIDATASLKDLSNLSGGQIYYNLLSNQSTVYANVGGDITTKFNNNIFDNSIFQSIEPIRGQVYNNHFTNVYLYFLNGINSAVTIVDLNINFNTQTQINIPNNLMSFISGNVNDKGSSVVGTMDITATGLLLDLDGFFINSDIIGIFEFTSTNPIETIDTIVRNFKGFPIMFKPATGLTLELLPTPVGTLSADGQIIADTVATISLDGDRGDYAILEPANVSGYQVWRLKQYTQTQ